MSDNLELVREMQQEIHHLESPITNDRRPELIHCRSLAGFVDYLYGNHDNFSSKDITILVQNTEEVIAYDKVTGAKVMRTPVIKADMVDFSKMTLNRDMYQEDAIIQLQTRCVRTPAVEKLIHAVSGLSYAESVKSTDDGVKNDINMTSQMQYNNGKPDSIVTIRPYRTFPEVEQPESQFLVRIGHDGTTPTIRLVETDGGMWKIEALNNIKAHLDLLVAENPITIIA